MFHRGEETPYATLPFPESYKIGDVYSMIVFDLNIEEFEYAYRIDGPRNPSAGLLFDKNQILLDPYARAVTGQNVWGIKKPHAYHARVVKDIFDWGDASQFMSFTCAASQSMTPPVLLTKAPLQD